MPSAVCPECESLVRITPTGEKKHRDFSAEWWQIADHSDERATVKHGVFSVEKRCDGSGRRV